MAKEHNKEWRLWALLLITILGVLYQIFTSYAIYGNEIKHVWIALTKIEEKIESIEQFLWQY